MDANLIQLSVCAGLTLAGLILVLLIWRLAKLRTSVWWLGLALLPISVYLVGLAPTMVDFGNAIVRWWWQVSPAMTAMTITGLTLGALGVLLMLVSRALPYRPRRPRGSGEASAVPPSRVRPTYEATPVSQSTPSDLPAQSP